MNKYQDYVEDANGNVLAGATVTVKAYPGLTTATIYESDGVTTKTNPITTDSQGGYSFYAAAGHYSLTMSHARISTKTVQDVYIGIDSGASGIIPIANGGTSNVTAAAALNALMPTQSGMAAYGLTSDGSTVGFNYYMGWHVVCTGTTGTAMQAAVTAAIALGYSAVILPSNKTYTFSDAEQVTVSLGASNSWHSVNIICFGKCTIDFSAYSTDKAALIFTNSGSGNSNNSYIRGIHFKGPGGGEGRGVEARGCNGFKAYDCTAELCYSLGKFSNLSAGLFTEDCKLINCQAYSTVNYLLEMYQTGTGDDSFHGSGLVNCITSTNSGAIKLTGLAKPYNAPLEVNIFSSGAGVSLPVVQNDSGADGITFSGYIKYEVAAGKPVVLGRGSSFYFIGDVYGVGDAPYIAGTCSVVKHNQGTHTGVSGYLGVERQFTYQNWDNAVEAVIGLNNPMMAYVTIKSNSTAVYDYRALLFLIPSNVGSVAGRVTVIDEWLRTDTLPHGKPNWTINTSGSLVAATMATAAIDPSHGIDLTFDGFQLGQTLAAFSGINRMDDFYSCSFLSTGVNTSTNVITIGNGHPWQQHGARVRYSNNGTGHVIANLTNGDDYYVHRLSNSTLTLHATVADALANTNAIVLSSAAAGTYALYWS